MNHYVEFLSPELLNYFLTQSQPYTNIQGLSHVGTTGGLETTDALKFLVEIYELHRDHLLKVLSQRKIDRDFLDQRTKACFDYNQKLNIDFTDSDYKTTLGLEDGEGRIVFGPLHQRYHQANSNQVAPLPDFLQGPHVTLFGPPDSTKLSINAMNAYHRELKNEPSIIKELLATHTSVPKWGADDEDSKTPLRQDLIDAGVNLTQCFEGSIRLEDKDKIYELKKDHLSLPLKRFPGLALPCPFLFYHNEPMPLHLYDFALHLFHNYKNAKSLTYYVPKLENEEEARYLKQMIESSEKLIQKRDANYKLGTIRLMIVLENPRAIVRTNEIMDELYPYFAGASLGWHDYLASTARLFKEDANYRIPVKADPNIVIKYIKASHRLLADVVGPRGGIKVGGMYGVLPIGTELFDPSFQVTMKGYFKDVITQLKRDLTGFWVAHPDFVRIGLALVEAWKFYQAGQKDKLHTLVKSLLLPQYHQEIIEFIEKEDIQGLSKDHEMYTRSLIVADLKESDFIKNNHPDEIRYNVFQSLQYLTDWLAGNGCVALPALIENTPVRVMDDLATAERSRWEVWHELYHGRFSIEEFLKIAHEEYLFIRKDYSNDKKIVQVKWNERTAKWYPVAFQLMIKLMTDQKPVEFATELLLPFTIESLRNAENPWREASTIAADKYAIHESVERFNYYFERCGDLDFAKTLSNNYLLDLELAQKLVMSFKFEQILNAASFHGDIGEGKKNLDLMAQREQALVFNEDEKIKFELAQLGQEYKSTFGMKFLISAKGKTGAEMLSALKLRLKNTKEGEVENAKKALWEITQKRFLEQPLNQTLMQAKTILIKHQVVGAQVSLINHHHIETYGLGHGEKDKREVSPKTHFELASLSKTVASLFALNYFFKKNISLDTAVNELLAKTGSQFRIPSLNASHPEWGNQVTIKDLMSHSALNHHYVNGVPLKQEMPAIDQFLTGNSQYGYQALGAINEPGKVFQYSGGGFIVLEHLIESLEKKSIFDLTRPFLKQYQIEEFHFEQQNQNAVDYAFGYNSTGNLIQDTRFMFPSFAAGAMGSTKGMSQVLILLEEAFNQPDHELHDCARLMLFGEDKGCQKFMGCLMGIGVFTIDAGDNKLMLHQGANDGFRAIFIHCYHGPDKGKGFVITCNGELNGVLFISELSQILLTELKFQGIDTSLFKNQFDLKNLKQEEIVNIGYKELVFKAFQPTLPEAIIQKGELDPLAAYNLVVGAKILEVTNQRFARAENLLSDHLPLFDPTLFGKQGKIMDSWETVRHNPYESDQFVFELLKKSSIQFVSLSTKFHFGNHAPFIKVEGYNDNLQSWEQILEKTAIEGHSYKNIKLPQKTNAFKKIRVSIYPDGGFTRLGLYENLPANVEGSFLALASCQSIPFSEKIPHTNKPLNIHYKPTPSEIEKNKIRIKNVKDLDLACVAFGAELTKATNEHYGPAIQVISPFSAMNMFDGLESARSRAQGHSEFIEVKLAQISTISRIEMDFQYFVNNNPLYVSVEALNIKGEWETLIAKNKVKAFAGNQKWFQVSSKNLYSHVRVVTYPDGGMNRLRIFA